MERIKVSRIPLSARAQEYLLDLIEEGTYQPGDQLPAETDLAAQLGISRPTLREALLHLEQQGVVIRKHGVGTFVAPDYELRLESGLERLESILELANRQRLEIRYVNLHVEERPADEELAGRLQVASGTPLTTIRRVLRAERKPVAYMDDIVPTATLAPGDVDERFNGSVLDLLRQHQDQSVAQAVSEIVALDADDDLAERLGVKPGRALLLLEETLFDEAGSVVGFSRNYFVPDFFRFHVIRR